VKFSNPLCPKTKFDLFMDNGWWMQGIYKITGEII
jgi:hypothetical protein